MDGKTSIYICALCIALVMAFSGCSKDTDPKTSPRPGTAGTPVSGDLNVSILPENPTANTDLHAVAAAMNTGQVSYRWTINGQDLVDEQTPILPAKGRFSKGDRLSVTVTVAGHSETSASVEIKNSPPVVTSIALLPEVIYRGVDITAGPVSFDADGDAVRFNYKWSINGEELAENSAMLSGNKLKRGDRVSLTVTPVDNEGEGEAVKTRTITIPNGPPRFVSTPPAAFKAETYSYQAVAEDPDKDPLTYALASAPEGMTIDATTGLISLRIKKEHAGTHTVVVTAQDPQGLKAEQKYSLTLTIP